MTGLPSAPAGRGRWALPSWNAMLVGALLVIASLVMATELPEYEVVIEDHGPLGAALSAKLVIERFQRDSNGQPSILETRGAQPGDRLVAVNGMSVMDMAPRDLRDLLREEGRPLVLRFQSKDGAARTIARLAPKQPPQSEEDIKAEGHMDVLEGPLSLFSMNVTRARFGAVASCFRRPVVAAEPFDACGELKEEKVKNKYVLVERGICSFGQKALNIMENGGLGMIVVNSEPGRFRMPAQEFFIGDEAFVAPPSVMVTPQDGEKLLKAMRASPGRLFVRLVVADECMREDGEWHRVHDVRWRDHPQMVDKLAKQRTQEKRARILEVRPVVSARGQRIDEQARGGSDGVKRVDIGASGEAVPARQNKTQIDVWDRQQGRRGRDAAKRSALSQRANVQRVEQGFRGGALELHVPMPPEQVAALKGGHHRALFAGDTRLVHAEFLGAGFGGPVPVGQVPGVLWVDSLDNCTTLQHKPASPGAVGVADVAELAERCGGDVGSALAAVLVMAQDAGLSMLLLLDMNGESPKPRYLSLEHLEGDARAFAQESLYMAVAELGADEGREVKRLLQANVFGEGLEAWVENQPEVADLWEILGSLQDPVSWPPDATHKRRLFYHLQQRHDPGSTDGGSLGRYRWLVEAYERAVALVGAVDSA